MYSTRARGRTPIREFDAQSGYLSPSSSRASSSSSARTVIDERMEWAHEERMRSASREPPPAQSPFYESSPFYAEYMENSVSAVDRKTLDAFEVHSCQKDTSVSSSGPGFPVGNSPLSSFETVWCQTLLEPFCRPLDEDFPRLLEKFSGFIKHRFGAVVDRLRLFRQEQEPSLDGLALERLDYALSFLEIEAHSSDPTASSSQDHDFKPEINCLDVSSAIVATREVSPENHQPIAVESVKEEASRAESGISTVAASSPSTEGTSIHSVHLSML